MLNKSFWYSIFPSIVWLLVIIAGSFLSSSSVPKVAISDKWIHFTFYAIFAFLLYLATLSYTNKLNAVVKRRVAVIVIATIVGVLIEIVQHFFIHGRHGEWLDLLANSLGIVVAIVVAENLKLKGVL